MCDSTTGITFVIFISSHPLSEIGPGAFAGRGMDAKDFFEHLSIDDRCPFHDGEGIRMLDGY